MTTTLVRAYLCHAGRSVRAGMLLAAALAVGLASPAMAESYAPVPAFGDLRFEKPLAMVPAPNDAKAWYVVEQRGIVWRIAQTASGFRRTVFADLRDRVDDGPNEAGLLGIALHPRFAENGRVYLSYTADGAPLISRIAEFVSRDGGLTLDAASERIVLSLEQPYENHNGGNIVFGPDGYLYIGFGDGGSAGDPHGNGQNLDTLLGKLLRLDIDGDTPYATPPDNPYAKAGGRPEIYASGLRNPWRFSFDRATGALWLADVGQNKWEEIDLIVRGGNYGWNRREGAHCFKSRTCSSEGLIDPVVEYGHNEGCSVTGGHVYRGRSLPALAGAYLYADYCSGKIWGLVPRSGGGYASPRTLLETAFRIASFGEDANGELYVLDHQGGRVYRLIAQ
jgi:glucose/arabinose dehydrogenase